MKTDKDVAEHATEHATDHVTEPREGVPARSLSKVLEQNEHVESLVEESAGELTALNSALKEEVADKAVAAEAVAVLKKGRAVEKKVQEASVKLATVNRALEGEIRDRHALESRLAEVTEKEAEVRHLAFHDPLTGLPNRALFSDRLEHGLAQAHRHERSLAVLFMDLDGFKGVNDEHGHDVGDAVLKIIAGRLAGNSREDDTVSRLGGDEFLYLLTESGTRDDIALVAHKIVTAVQAPLEIDANGRTITLRIRPSIGIAVFPADGSTADALVKRADQAMYAAKRSGSGYVFAQASTD